MMRLVALIAAAGLAAVAAWMVRSAPTWEPDIQWLAEFESVDG